jgi:peptide/nickel transport system substrate-binding protein
MWRNQDLRSSHYDPAAAARLLTGIGWQLKDGVLRDEKGHVVEFSIMSNAGNAPRAKMLALIQQDLAKIGMHVTIVTLDFPALIERVTSSFDYDACLLGTTNATPGPESTRNIWLSSSPDHQWSPKEVHPSTLWEADLDRELHSVDSATSLAARKRSFDHMQQIVADEQPILYLVYRNRISGISPKVTGVRPSVLAPPWWNIEEIGVNP